MRRTSVTTSPRPLSLPFGFLVELARMTSKTKKEDEEEEDETAEPVAPEVMGMMRELWPKKEERENLTDSLYNDLLKTCAGGPEQRRVCVRVDSPARRTCLTDRGSTVQRQRCFTFTSSRPFNMRGKKPNQTRLQRERNQLYLILWGAWTTAWCITR
eukprot:m.393151 g.393151  ORF g.393151 m.393151 type:complete len:157 (-) comp16765_c0_seq5:149-619(-)